MNDLLIPIHIAFSGYALIGLTLLIMAATITVFLLRISVKSHATWYLITFFALVTCSGAASILANAIFYWDRLFIPWQDFWIVAAGAALSQFAYCFPNYEPSTESRRVLILMGSLTLVAFLYCVVFDLRFLFFWSPDLDVSDAFYLLLPIGTAIVILIFLRRSVYYSQLTVSEMALSRENGVWQHLIHPQGRYALALRNMALALSLAFLPGVQTIVQWPYPYGFILSNIGALLAISLLALVYFSYAPEASSFMSKLVGITLAVVLLFFSVIGSMDVYRTGVQYSLNLRSSLSVVLEEILRTGELVAVPPQVAYTLSWVAEKPDDATAYQMLYARPNAAAPELSQLIEDNGSGYLERWSHPHVFSEIPLANHDWQWIPRYTTYPVGSGQEDYAGYIFVENGTAYEIGFSMLEMGDALSQQVTWWMSMILISSVLVLLVFPRFFHQALVAPLENLIAGVGWINQGELETAVPVQFNDEIGYLTRSFNKLMETLKQSQNQQTMLFAQLQASYDELEARIMNRTQELSAFTDLTMLPGEQESLTDILQPALTHIIEIGLCQALSVHVLTENQQSLALAAHRFLPETAVHTQTAIPLSSPFDTRFKQIDAPLLVRPNSEQPLLPTAFKIHDYPVYLGSPLTAGDQVHGWLSCYRTGAREFTMGEISLLVALARQMGIIVENYQLRERIQQVAAYDERKRLARDLHDSVTQLLYSITLFTRASEEALEDGDNIRLGFSLDQLSNISQQALREMRFLLFELQPPSLEEMGLVQALDARFDMVERRLGVRVMFETDRFVSPSKEVDNELSFVAIEALNNSIKHGNATQVHLEIKNEEDYICLIVADNGRGFEPSQVSHGMGLSNMRHRAESVGGTLTIESASNTGTKVTMTVPVSESLQNNL